MKQFNISMITFLGFILSGLMMSCEKEGELNFTERRVVGTWTYEKVKFAPNWSFNRNDVTSEYQNYQLTFNNDFTAEYRDMASGIVDNGVWEIVEVNDPECASTQLFTSFSNSEEGRHFQLVFSDMWVSKKKLRGTYQDDDGCFNYILARQ